MADGAVDVAVEAISEANNLFTFDLYKILAGGSDNLFFSPLSIQVILAFVYFGAGGDTAKEILRGLRLPNDNHVIEKGIEATMRHLKASDNVMLDIANRAFLHANFPLIEAFKVSAAKFMAGIEEVNFHNEAAARKIINDWVEEKTHDKIKDLIPAGALTDDTCLVLVNAIYFKGDWLKQFKKDATAPMNFYSATGAEKVDMMQLRDHFQYADLYDLKCQALLLPYKGKKTSMMIFLPTQMNGLSELGTRLASLRLRDVINRMYERDVIVYFPKFKMEYDKELKTTLARLGMVSMFDERKANFTGISDEPLVVDKVLHKAFIEVNEEGTEAAAATAVIFSMITSVGAGPPPPVVFKADRPFLFLILDQETKMVLFAGHYLVPPK